MRFYTNVQMIGNNFLVRGYEDGRKVMFQEKYNPTLFVKSRKETKWKTLEGEHVEPIKPGLVRECRDFIKKYDGVEDSRSTETRDISISISLTSILKRRLSSISTKSDWSRWILRFSLKKDSPVLTHVLRRCCPSRFKTNNDQKRSPLGVVILILPHRRIKTYHYHSDEV